MGVVYLARDLTLGRKVALKVVVSRKATTQEAISQFLLEAKATARLNHPHIVTVYGAGDVDGLPYMALEFLEGESLRDRAQRERMGVGAVLQTGRAIADALSAAHARKILHRDLKPENVMLPRDGRLRVLDFGLAQVLPRSPEEAARQTRSADSFDTAELARLGTPSAGAVGTIPYMAPEQWSQGSCTSAVDVWALGVLLFELLAGQRPYEGEWMTVAHSVVSDEPAPDLADVAPAIPEPVCALVARCLCKDPAGRPTAEEVLAELVQLTAARRSRGRENSESPYRGLLPFEPRHADLFFGRTLEIEAFLEKMREQALLPVVGPSGAGKSSFVMGGVVPVLLDRGDWSVLALRPGRRPLWTLASKLASGDSSWITRSSGKGDRRRTRDAWSDMVPQEAAGLCEYLRASPQGLGILLRKISADLRCSVLLVVDQFEEMFTLDIASESRRAFVDALLLAADDSEGPIRVVVTMREDFLGHLTENPGLSEAITRGVVVLPRPGAAALSEALTGPLEPFGHRFEDDGLVPEIVDAVLAEPGGLPMLQFVAQSLWELRDRDRKLLLRSAYETIGGVDGALATHAERTLQGLTSAQQRAARALLLRLVTDEQTRSVVSRDDLLHVTRGHTDTEIVLQQLVQARLLTVREGESRDGPPTLELVHEALIRHWERLQGWLAEDQEGHRLVHALGRAAREWEARGRPDSLLWRGEMLEEFRRWRRRSDSRLAGAEEVFTRRSLAAHGRRRWILVGSTVIAILMLLLFSIAQLRARRAADAAA
jgi:serine/threonine protein kinase